jgi:hypothetical protein
MKRSCFIKGVPESKLVGGTFIQPYQLVYELGLCV